MLVEADFNESEEEFHEGSEEETSQPLKKKAKVDNRSTIFI